MSARKDTVWAPQGKGATHVLALQAKTLAHTVPTPDALRSEGHEEALRRRAAAGCTCHHRGRGGGGGPACMCVLHSVCARTRVCVRACMCVLQCESACACVCAQGEGYRCEFVAHPQQKDRVNLRLFGGPIGMLCCAGFKWVSQFL